MDAKLALELLRTGLAALGAFRQWRATASPDQVKAFVDEIHAAGGSVDLAAVDAVLADMKQSGADLDAKLAARGL